jgi:hypothetical protein
MFFTTVHKNASEDVLHLAPIIFIYEFGCSLSFHYSLPLTKVGLLQTQTHYNMGIKFASVPKLTMHEDEDN